MGKRMEARESARMQIYGLTQVQIAYLAGIVDMSGCLCCFIVERPKTRALSYVSRLVLESIAKEPLATISQWLELEVKEYPSRKFGWAGRSKILISKAHLVPLLERILPYLNAKKGEASIIIAFERLRVSLEPLTVGKRGKISLPDSFREQMEALCRDSQSFKQSPRGHAQSFVREGRAA